MPNVGSKSGDTLGIEVEDGCSDPSSSSTSSGSGSLRKMVLVLVLGLPIEEIGVLVGSVGGFERGVPTAFIAEYHRPHSPCVGAALVVARTEEEVIPGNDKACR